MPISRVDVDPGEASSARFDARRLVTLLQRHLPLRARMAAKARGAVANSRRSSLCSVTQIFDAGDIGLVCQLQLVDAGASAAIILAPITQLSFDRGSPVYREIAAYQKRRRARHAQP